MMVVVVVLVVVEEEEVVEKVDKAITKTVITVQVYW